MICFYGCLSCSDASPFVFALSCLDGCTAMMCELITSANHNTWHLYKFEQLPFFFL